MRSLSIIALAFAAACVHEPPVPRVPRPAVTLTQPARVCHHGRPPAEPCRAVAEIERWLAEPTLTILDARETQTGRQGARILTLRASGGVVFRAKWRPNASSHSRNSPRRELAAYEVQKLYLDPDEYVVPPTAPHCFPLDAYRRAIDATATPTFSGTRCVYGVLSYWLEDVESLPAAHEDGWFHGLHDHALDPELFGTNAVYRDSIADVNLFTYLIGHGDTHADNFVIARDRRSPRVYSVDNSLSLGLRKSSRLDPEHDWSTIHVPALRRASIDRLRALDDDALQALESVAELELSDDQMRVVAPIRRAPKRTGMDLVDGHLRIGLTQSEIDAIRRRIDLLRTRAADGKLRLF